MIDYNYLLQRLHECKEPDYDLTREAATAIEALRGPERERPSWDEWFVQLAEFVAARSKDPSTKCGAVIVRPDKTIAATGYNGFPRSIADKPELLNNREEKYKRVVHAEMNAILTAHEPLTGYTLFVTGPCCERCASHVVQAGIKRVVCRTPTADYLSRWNTDVTEQLFGEAGVTFDLIGDQSG